MVLKKYISPEMKVVAFRTETTLKTASAVTNPDETEIIIRVTRLFD